MAHPHGLIQQAMGWMLRKAGKRSPEAPEEFLAPLSADCPEQPSGMPLSECPFTNGRVSWPADRLYW